MRKSILYEAINISIANIEKHPNRKNFIHYSFVVQGKIIEWGTNNNKVPALHYGYHSRIEDHRFKPKTHSEVAAYWKAKGLLERNRSFDLINIRLNRMGQMRNSKPCFCCYGLLKALGCDTFYYSTEDNFMNIG